MKGQVCVVHDFHILKVSTRWLIIIVEGQVCIIHYFHILKVSTRWFYHYRERTGMHHTWFPHPKSQLGDFIIILEGQVYIIHDFHTLKVSTRWLYGCRGRTSVHRTWFQSPKIPTSWQQPSNQCYECLSSLNAITSDKDNFNNAAS